MEAVSEPGEDVIPFVRNVRLFSEDEKAATASFNDIIDEHMKDYEEINYDEMVYLDDVAELDATDIFNSEMEEHIVDGNNMVQEALLEQALFELDDISNNVQQQLYFNETASAEDHVGADYERRSQ